MTTCPLCGFEFDKNGMACHTACPLSRQCSIVCCPNCGYQMPDEDRAGVVTALRRLWAALGPKRADPVPSEAPTNLCPLTALAVGQQGEVAEVRSGASKRLAHLSALGLVPGCRVQVRQRSLAYVVQVDETEVAIDSQIAGEILVRLQ
jgi:Fe2+ transport system protein FeoA